MVIRPLEIRYIGKTVELSPLKPPARISQLQVRHDSISQQIADLERRLTDLRYIRDNQYWQRREPSFDNPGFDLIGVKFQRDNGFTARIYLDHAIDRGILGSKPVEDTFRWPDEIVTENQPDWACKALAF